MSLELCLSEPMSPSVPRFARSRSFSPQLRAKFLTQIGSVCLRISAMTWITTFMEHPSNADEVLVEFLAALSKGGENLRANAVKIVRTILQSADVSVLPQTRDSFLRGVELYENRADKQYSLTDCISMNAMKKESLSEILSNDAHLNRRVLQF